MPFSKRRKRVILPAGRRLGLIFGERRPPGGSQLPVVAVGTNVAAYSFDHGATWTLGTIPAGTYNSVAFGGGRFVAVGTNVAAYSLDGKTWTAGTIAAGTWNRCAFGAGVFVAVEGTGGVATALYSTDGGATWTTTPITIASFNDVAYGTDGFVAVSGSGPARRSVDGITWTGTATIGTRTSIAYSPSVDTYTSLGSSSTLVRYSSDGLAWNSVSTFPLGGAIREIVWNGSIFVAVAQNAVAAAVATSPDGITYTSQTIPAPFKAWISVTWDGTVFIAIDSSGFVMTSSDGITWSTPTDVIAGGGWIRLAAPRRKNEVTG